MVSLAQLKAQQQRRRIEQRRQQSISRQRAANKIAELQREIEESKRKRESIRKGTRKGGVRGQKRLTNFIKGRQAAIDFLEKELRAGRSITDQKLKEAEKIRRQTTNRLERQRQRSLTPGSSLKKVTVKQAPTKIPKTVFTDQKVRKETFNELGAGFLSKVYTPKQQTQVLTSVLTTSKAQASDFLQRQLKQIDNRKDLTELEKEEAKRALLKIPSGRGRKEIGLGARLEKQAKAKQEQISKLLNLTKEEKLNNKIITGQSLTNEEILKINRLASQKLDKLTKQSVNLIKGTPYNVALGTIEVGKEILLIPKELARATIWVGETSIRQQQEALKKGRSLAAELASDLYTVSGNVVKSSTKIGRYIVNNPKSSALIVGTAINAGLGLSVRQFFKNPIKSFTKALLYLNPRNIIGKGIGKIIRLPKRLEKLFFAADDIANAKKQLARTNKAIETARKIGASKTTLKKLQTLENIEKAELELLQRAKELQKRLPQFFAKSDIDTFKRTGKLPDKPKIKPNVSPKKVDEFTNALNELEKKNRKIRSDRRRIRKTLSDAEKANLIKDLTKSSITIKKPVKLNKQETKVFNKFISDYNSLQRRINTLKNQISKPNISSLRKTILQQELKSLNDLRSNVLKSFNKEVLGGNFVSIKDKSEFIKEIRKLNRNLKDTLKIRSIITKIIKLENKLKAAGVKDINLLEPSKANRIKKVLSKVREISNLSTSQLGQLEKSVDNLLKISFKKVKPKPKFNKKAFTNEIIKGKKSSNLTKSDLEKILSSPKPNTLLKQRLAATRKQLNKLENQIKQAKEFGKFLNKKEKQALGKQISQAIEETKNLKSTITRLDKELKGLKKGVSEKQTLSRKQKFAAARREAKSIKITSKSVTDTSKTKLLKVGDFEIEVEYSNWGFGKKGSLGAQTIKQKPTFKVRVTKATKEEYGAPVDNFNSRAQKAYRNDPNYKRNQQFNQKLKTLDNRLEKIDQRKLDTKQKKTLEQARKEIRDLIEAQEKINDRALLKVFGILFGIKNAVSKTQARQQARDLARVQKAIPRLNNIIKEIKKPVKPKPITEKSKAARPLRKTPRTLRKPPGKAPRKPPKQPPRTSRPPGKPPGKAPRKPLKLPDLDFDSKKLDNRVVEFVGVYRERKNRAKPASKSNPVITKRIRLKTTKNRALKRVANLTDKTTVRSLDLKVVGVTDRKVKDIKKPNVLKKFRTKKSKGTPVLKLVEKSKFTIDTRGERRGLSISKALKQKKTKKVRKSTKKTKKSPQKASKSKKK